MKIRRRRLWNFYSRHSAYGDEALSGRRFNIKED